MAQLMAQRLKAAHVSSGNLLRETSQRKDPLGEEISRIMRAGGLVPDGLVNRLIFDHVERLGRGSFILDGFPRTVEQAQGLDEALERLKNSIDLAVDFEVSTETIVTRLSGRRVCQRCGTNYHDQRLPPRCSGVCDQCGGPLIRRPDDEPETILNRLKVYEQQTQPLLSFYQAQGKLRTLSGESQVEVQYQALAELLKKERLISDAG